MPVQKKLKPVKKAKSKIVLLEDLEAGDTGVFQSGQAVRATTWSPAEKTEVYVFGRGVKFQVLQKNRCSQRVKLSFRDKDKPAQVVTLVFNRNEGVEVEKI